MSAAVEENPRDLEQTEPLLTDKKTLREAPSFIGVRHIGLPAKDPAALAVFYRDVLGMKIMRQTPSDARYGATAFLAAGYNLYGALSVKRAS